jgi:hypothetical protein
MWRQVDQDRAAAHGAAARARWHSGVISAPSRGDIVGSWARAGFGAHARSRQGRVREYVTAGGENVRAEPAGIEAAAGDEVTQEC